MGKMAVASPPTHPERRAPLGCTTLFGLVPRFAVPAWSPTGQRIYQERHSPQTQILTDGRWLWTRTVGFT